MMAKWTAIIIIVFFPNHISIALNLHLSNSFDNCITPIVVRVANRKSYHFMLLTHIMNISEQSNNLKKGISKNNKNNNLRGILVAPVEQ